jgi:hypothetical protein
MISEREATRFFSILFSSLQVATANSMGVHSFGPSGQSVGGSRLGILDISVWDIECSRVEARVQILSVHRYCQKSRTAVPTAWSSTSLIRRSILLAFKKQMNVGVEVLSGCYDIDECCKRKLDRY